MLHLLFGRFCSNTEFNLLTRLCKYFLVFICGNNFSKLKLRNVLNKSFSHRNSMSVYCESNKYACAYHIHTHFTMPNPHWHSIFLSWGRKGEDCDTCVPNNRTMFSTYVSMSEQLKLVLNPRTHTLETKNLFGIRMFFVLICSKFPTSILVGIQFTPLSFEIFILHSSRLANHHGFDPLLLSRITMKWIYLLWAKYQPLADSIKQCNITITYLWKWAYTGLNTQFSTLFVVKILNFGAELCHIIVFF